MIDSKRIFRWWILPSAVVSGAFIGILLEVVLFPVDVLAFRLGSLHLAYVGIMVLALDLFLGIGDHRRFIALGLMIGGAIQAIGRYIGSGGATSLETSAVSSSSILSTAVVIILISIIGMLGRGWRKSPIWSSATSRWRWGGAAILLSLFVVNRAGQTILRMADVSNELRSLIFGAVEVHHLIVGLMLLVFLVPLSLTVSLMESKVAIWRVLLAVAIALVADQFSYLGLSEISDDTYFERISMIGGALATGFCILWFLFRRSPRRMQRVS